MNFLSNVKIQSKSTFTAFDIYESLDLSVRPCDNFYQFACGGWEKRHAVRQDYDFVDMVSHTDKNYINTLTELLEVPERSTDPHMTRQSKRFYFSCIRGISADLGTKLQTLAQLVNGLPVISKNYNTNQLQLEDMYSDAAVYSKIFGESLFAFSVRPFGNVHVLLVSVMSWLTHCVFCVYA